MIEKLEELHEYVAETKRLAAELGMDLRISLVRSSTPTGNGKRRPKRRRARQGSYDWDSVDWSLNNAQIAKRLGCAKNAVRWQRRKREAEGATT